jgi:hypothetical protein
MGDNGIARDHLIEHMTRPPLESMKFSEITSNQSTCGHVDSRYA